MKLLKAIGGGGLPVALTLLRAPAALAAGSGTATGENTPLQLTGTSTSTHASAAGGSSLVRTIVGLFIVIVVIYGISWILRQVKASKNRPTGTGLSQLASLPLGGGRMLALVRAGREVHLVGIAEHGVTPIRSYTEAELIASGLEVPEEEAPNFDPAEKPLERVLDVLRRMTVRS
jgi:flagellar protein FliO/FliZ